MQTRRFLPALLSIAAGLFSGSGRPDKEHQLTDTNGSTPEIFPGICRGNSGASNRWRQRHARPPGHSGRRNGKPFRQLITNPKFMNRCQRARYVAGQEIWV